MKHTKEFLELQMKFGIFKVLTQILLETLDDPIRVPTKETKALMDKFKELMPEIERMNEKFNIEGTHGSTFFSVLEAKVLYNFRKAYKL